MDVGSKDEMRDIIAKDLLSIHNRRVEMSRRLADNLEEHLDYLRALFAQFSQPTSGPVAAKTPRFVRKRALHRIETIPENDVLRQRDTSVESAQSVTEAEKEVNEVSTVGRKSKRAASQRATDNIRKQQNSPYSKLRRLANDETDGISEKKGKSESRREEIKIIKRKKSRMSSSDEDDSRRHPKHSKLDEKLMETSESAKRVTREGKQSGQEEVARSNETVEETAKEIEERDAFSKLQRSNRSRSKSQDEDMKKADDAIVTSVADDVDEPSMYEDAIGKTTPIMNSTVKDSFIMPEKILNATVVLEPLQQRKLNETIVIKKKSSSQQSNGEARRSTSSNKALQDSIRTYKTVAQDTYNGLITEDESSPEVRRAKKQISKKQNIGKRQNKHVLSSSDDEIPPTPEKTRLKKASGAPAVVQEMKTLYKSNALFSPYAKESVKKRVEAFEQAVMHSPKPVNVDAPVRMTRTKTRAMAAAETRNTEAETETRNTDKNVGQLLARKSLAKAKKIAYLVEKQKKDEEFKENKEQREPERINKLFLNDKQNVKQMQLKITPLKKILPPTPINRLQTPSNTQNLSNYSKTLTASRTNIITNVESFIQAPKTASKNNSTEKLEEKKRYEEDARKKKDEALRLQTEEKRRKRQEKELKNRLAREAKEKQELEKRQKAEKEREEKARLAQLMQEKQREEMERKRQALLQRAQEKEERRKLEEQQRWQKLQEQEEAERLLAEQRRREQDAEKRREAEARAQQQATTAETLRQKQQMLAAQAKHKQANNKLHQGATNYVLDSEPDDDESDDESKPKHEIPYWAQPHVRKTQLAMQRYVPEEIVYKFFDTRKCTPDLTELFHGIDRNRLKRTSSAIWKTPPRFSMMEAE